MRAALPLLLAACTAGTDTDPVAPEPGPAPPGAVELAVDPIQTTGGEPFTVQILTPSVDPDGDDVTYRYGWVRNGQRLEFTGDTIAAADSVHGDVWQVSVVPTDGLHDGPIASIDVRVGNRGPQPPVLQFSSTRANERIRLVFETPEDPDGDELFATTVWYMTEGDASDEVEVPELKDRFAITADLAKLDRTFRVVMTITDNFNPSVTAEGSVTIQYDCTDIPAFNLGDSTIRNARGYHGLGMMDDGTLLGWDGRSALVKSQYRAGFEAFVPGQYQIEQIDRMSDGDFVIANAGNRRLVRVTAAGATTPISGDVGGVYGVTVGPDEKLWSADQGVRRTDPVTGETETIVRSNWGNTAHSLNFNLDSTRLYIGTIGNGTVYELELDADLNPVGNPRPFATGIGGWHDGIEVDVCGNLYVADYSTSGLYRVDLNGDHTLIVTPTFNLYGHGTTWGNGVGGWRTDAIYQPQPYNGNTVREVIVGITSADAVRTWNGVQVPW